MVSIADDLRAAADTLHRGSSRCEDPECWTCRFQREQAALATRLEAHASTIERVEGEIARQIHDRPGPAQIRKWRDALRGDSNG